MPTDFMSSKKWKDGQMRRLIQKKKLEIKEIWCFMKSIGKTQDHRHDEKEDKRKKPR